MPAPLQGISPNESGQNQTFRSVTCPFCGLHCDDLVIRNDAGRLTIDANGCPRAAAGFERVVAADASPQIAGRDATLADAIARAAELIGKAKLPLYGGLGTDVEGMRAMMALADRSGGVVDHVLSNAQYRNVGVLQTRGWIMSTLTETRNRADLIVVVGSDLSIHHPRFYERIASPAEAMFGEAEAKRTIVLLGKGTPAGDVKGDRIGEVLDLGCAPSDIPGVLAAVRAALHGAPSTGPVGGIAADTIAHLAERCRNAHYSVFVWAPQALTFDGADLAVHMIADIVRDLNKTTRSAGLSLGGNDGIASAASVCSWQSGYPLRVSFASGAPEFDPYRFEVRRMLAEGEGDLLVWVASFGPDPSPPPETKLPTIVLGAPGIRLARAPEVFIPLGTPGLDHGGRLVRCDNVVSLPLRKLRSTGLATLPDVAGAITAAL